MRMNYSHSEGSAQIDLRGDHLSAKLRLAAKRYRWIGIGMVLGAMALYLLGTFVTQTGVPYVRQAIASIFINLPTSTNIDLLFLDAITILAIGFLVTSYRLQTEETAASTPSIFGYPLRAPRAEFLHTIERIVTEHPDMSYSLALFDIDGFKVINDRHGTALADEVLLHVCDNLPMWLPKTARVARFGSDEFLAFLPNTTLDEARGLVQAVLDGIGGQRAASASGQTVIVTLSSGIASYPGTSQDLRDAISQATSALHDAKEQGRSGVELARKNNVGLCRLGAQVESALSDQRVRPAYQPIINLQNGRLVAEEGLARIVLPEGQILGADLFMNAATDLRLTSRIDCCLIEQALARCRTQSAQGDRRLRFMNVSAAFLNERRILEKIAFSFTSCGILGELLGDANPLVVEITERELLRDPKGALECLQPLLDLGVRLAIDDFGSGYSSFLYLTSLPVSFLKIEMELLKTARSSQRARSILRGIRAIANDLNIVTVAEGIEDEELAAIAVDLGMDWGQGFYFGKPTFGEPVSTPTSLAVSRSSNLKYDGFTMARR